VLQRPPKWLDGVGLKMNPGLHLLPCALPGGVLVSCVHFRLAVPRRIEPLGCVVGGRGREKYVRVCTKARQNNQ